MSYEAKQHLKFPHEKFILTSKKSVLTEELMKDLRSYYDNSPRSAHLGKRQEIMEHNTHIIYI